MCCWRRSRWRRSQTISVRRGDRVEAGAAIAELESGRRQDRRGAGGSALAQAEAQLADLQVGKRPEEIAVLEAMVRSAKREAEEKRRVLARRRICSSAASPRRPSSTRRRPPSRSREARDRPGRGQSRRRQAAGAAGGIKAAENQVKQAGTALEQAHGGCRSARSRRRRPAASTTSSAIPATSPARRRRSSRCCPTAR